MMGKACSLKSKLINGGDGILLVVLAVSISQVMTLIWSMNPSGSQFGIFAMEFKDFLSSIIAKS